MTVDSKCPCEIPYTEMERPSTEQVHILLSIDPVASSKLGFQDRGEELASSPAYEPNSPGRSLASAPVGCDVRRPRTASVHQRGSRTRARSYQFRQSANRISLSTLRSGPFGSPADASQYRADSVRIPHLASRIRAATPLATLRPVFVYPPSARKPLVVPSPYQPEHTCI